MVFGSHHTGLYVGLVEQIYPVRPDWGRIPKEAAQYLMAMNQGIGVYRAYAGFSLQYADTTGMFHAMPPVLLVGWVSVFGRFCVLWRPKVYRKSILNLCI